MLEKLIHMTRAQDQGGPRPVMLAIAGDSASGKTTLTKGLAQAIGEDRCLTICVGDFFVYRSPPIPPPAGWSYCSALA